MNAFILAFIIFINLTDRSTEVRKAFYMASESSKANNEFRKLLSGLSSEDPLILGYKGMSEMLVAYHSYNPVTKYLAFARGRDMLEAAIMKDPFNMELRFLRYSVQKNAPGFLLYSSSVLNDKKLLESALKSNELDADLRSRILEFFSKTN